MTLRRAGARVFAGLALASLVVGSTFMAWALISPARGPFWSATPGEGYFWVRTLALVLLLPMTLIAVLAFSTVARLLSPRVS